MPALAAFDSAGVKVVVLGQIAGILHGSTELTGDLHLRWSGGVEDSAAMARTFDRIEAELTDEDGRPIATDDAAFRRPEVLFRSEHACGDCCTAHLPWGGHDVRAFIDHSERCEVDGVTVHYLALDDLQAMRRAVDRLHR